MIVLSVSSTNKKYPMCHHKTPKIREEYKKPKKQAYKKQLFSCLGSILAS